MDTYNIVGNEVKCPFLQKFSIVIFEIILSESCHMVLVTQKLVHSCGCKTHFRHLTDMSREVKFYSVQVNSIPVSGKSAAGPLIYSRAGFITKDNCCTIATL